jgi:hypothetical protein
MYHSCNTILHFSICGTSCLSHAQFTISAILTIPLKKHFFNLYKSPPQKLCIQTLNENNNSVIKDINVYIESQKVAIFLLFFIFSKYYYLIINHVQMPNAFMLLYLYAKPKKKILIICLSLIGVLLLFLEILVLSFYHP